MKSPKLSLLAIFSFVTLVLMGSLLLSFNKIDAFSTGDFSGVNVINNPGDVDGADDPVNRGYNDLGGSGWTGGGNKGGGSNGGGTTPVITPSVNTDSVIVVVTAAGEPSGYLTASDDSCIIRADKNSCNVEFNWGTTNGVGTSSVTRNPEEGFTIQNADPGANVPLPVYHGISNFFLYNNGLKLAETSVGASCEAGTTWVAGEGKCILDVAVENFSTPNCTIAIGESSCTSNISWNISGGYGDFSLTTPTNIVVSSSKSGSTNYTISYPSRSFSLINNANVLKGSTSYADCIAGSSWNSTQNKCVATNVIGTISSTSCVIASGENTCASSVSWSTTNVTDPVIKQNGVQFSALASGTQSRVISYGTTNFGLYNGLTLLNSSNATATCASGTSWNEAENICSSEIIEGSLSFSATNCTIASGGNSCNSLLSWASTLTGTFAITTPTDITVSSSSTGTNYPYKTEYPQRKFFAYNNGNLVAERVAYAECEDKTIWSTIDNKCMPKEVVSCAEPTSRIVEVTCDPNEKGEQAVSGSVKREQTKTYPACIFDEPITINNSVYVSDSCVYPSEDGNGGEGDGSNGDPRWGTPICGNCGEGVQQVWCTETCDSDPSTGRFCLGDTNKDGVRNYPSNCQSGGGSLGRGTPILNIVIQLTPEKIVKGRSATLSWDSNSDSCVAVVGGEYGYFETNGANNGSFLVAPTETTSYRIQCEKGEVTEPAEATLKVTNVNIFES